MTTITQVNTQQILESLSTTSIEGLLDAARQLRAAVDLTEDEQIVAAAIFAEIDSIQRLVDRSNTNKTITSMEFDSVSLQDLMDASRKFANAVDMTEDEQIVAAAVWAELEERNRVIRENGKLIYTSENGSVLIAPPGAKSVQIRKPAKEVK